MSVPLFTHRRAGAIATGFFLIGLAICLYLNVLWPWILVVIGVSACTRQYLRGRIYDAAVSGAIFFGLFFISYFDEWDSVIPVVLVIAGIFIIFRELFGQRIRLGKEKIEDDAHEMSEDEHGD